MRTRSPESSTLTTTSPAQEEESLGQDQNQKGRNAGLVHARGGLGPEEVRSVDPRSAPDPGNDQARRSAPDQGRDRALEKVAQRAAANRRLASKVIASKLTR